jgi:metal-responsive CopG/Arc/MetJ family transcriptional regulator
MNEHRIVLKLNQQQLELLDRTIARGVAADRASLVRLALREYAAAHRGDEWRPSGAGAGAPE